MPEHGVTGSGEGEVEQESQITATAAIPVADLEVAVALEGATATATAAIPEHGIAATAGVLPPTITAAAAIPTPGIAARVQAWPAEAFAGTPASVGAGLQACYTFDVVGSEGEDSLGNYDLTKTGTVSAETGGIRGRYVRSVSSGYLSLSTTAFRQTRDFSIAV